MQRKMASKIYTLIGLLLIFAFISVYEVSGRRCYTCTGVANLTECHTVSDCSSDMSAIADGKKVYVVVGDAYDMICCSIHKCYATKYYRELDGAYVHDLACRSQADCTARSKRDISVWQSCCDGEYCNKNFDHAGAPLDPQYHSRHCYSCSGVADPLDCLTTITCDANQACFTAEHIDTGGKPVFVMNCLGVNDCIQIGHHIPFGKRTTMCRACCNEKENCNNQFCSKKLGITGENPLGSSVEPPAISTPAPQITYKTVITPSNHVGYLNGDADFNCSFHHNDPSLTKVRYVWSFTGQTHETIYNNTLTDMSLVLTIHSLQTEDYGTYYCDIFYNGHKYSDSATLTPASIK